VLIDHITSAVLVSLAYAAVLPDGDDSLMTTADVWRRHDLGVFLTERRSRSEIAWELPSVLAGEEAVRFCPADRAWVSCEVARQTSVGTEWHAEGALVHLDAVIYPDPGVLVGPPSRNPLQGEDRQALPRSSSLRSRSGSHWPRSNVVAILEEGRRRVAAGVVGIQDTLSWRAAAGPWLASQGRDPAELLTLVELLRAGIGGATIDADRLEPWGASAPRLTDCLCRTFQPFVGLDQFSDRSGVGHLGLFTPELRLRLTELMYSLDIPHELYPLLYDAAIRDLRRRPVAGDHADWFSVVRAMHDLDAEAVARFMDELSRTVALVPVGGGG
jgi:hypothetical protein